MPENMIINIPYDDRTIDLSIPAVNIGTVIGGKVPIREMDNPIRHALKKAKEPALKDLVKERRVGLVVADATREVPLQSLLSATMPELNQALEVHLFIATGTHAPNMDGNAEIAGLVRQHARANGYDIQHIIYHDCQAGPWIYSGQTRSHKNDIYVNAAVGDCDVFVTFSEMKNHYFAGYSNPLKNFIPGLARQDSIMRNHALTLEESSTFGLHPLHPDHARRNNPLAKDILEAFRLIVKNRPVFAVTTISKKTDVLWAAAGLVEQVVPVTIQQVDERMSIRLEPAEFMVISCGGYPNDESLYIAQRALELTSQGIRNGGEILFMAGCRNGIGSGKSEENFYLPLTEDIDKIVNTPVINYRLYAHKPIKFARLIKRMGKIHFYTNLSAEKVSRIHLKPVNDPQQIIDHWLQEKPDAKIHVAPDGNKYAVYRSVTES